MLLIFLSSQALSYGFHYAACLWHLCLFILSAAHTHTLYIYKFVHIHGQTIEQPQVFDHNRFTNSMCTHSACAVYTVHISFSFSLLKSFRHFIQLYINRLYSKFRWKSFVCVQFRVWMLSQDVVKNHNKFLLELGSDKVYECVCV